MIYFDKKKELERISKDGISSDDIFANDKLTEYMADLIANSSYRKKQIIDKAKEISVKVFNGLPDDLIEAELEPLYIDAKRLAKTRNKNKREETKVITLYRDEMEKICDLEDDRLMRLAFATLIIHKYQGYYTSNGKMGCHNSVAFCKSVAFHIAGLESVSGRKKNELWSELARRGYLIVNTRVNNSYKHTRKWIAMNLLTVPYNVDILPLEEKPEVYLPISSYDNLLLYLYHYLDQAEATLCDDCHTLIPKTSNRKRLCDDCAKRRKQESNRTSRTGKDTA